MLICKPYFVLACFLKEIKVSYTAYLHDLVLVVEMATLLKDSAALPTLFLQVRL